MDGGTVKYKGIDIPTLIIPKGTLLFRATDDEEKDFTGPVTFPGETCVPYNYNVFFYTNPFVVDALDWFKDLKYVKAYVTLHDVRIVSMINPSNKFNRSSRDTAKFPLAKCETIKDTCIEKNDELRKAQATNPCFKKDFIENETDIHGWIAIAKEDADKFKANKGKIKADVAVVEDSRGVKGPAEIALYPLKNREAKDIVLRYPDDFRAGQSFNYKTIANLKRDCSLGSYNERARFLSQHAQYDAETKLFKYKEKAETKVFYNYDDVENIAKKCFEKGKESERPTISSGFESSPPEIGGPWAIDLASIRRTLKYVIEHLSHACYLLCVINGKPSLYKIQTNTTAKGFKRALTKKGAITLRKRYADVKEWRIIQCLVRPFDTASVTFTEEYDMFFSEFPTALPDGLFLLNITDAVLLRRDRTEPWPMVTGKFNLSADYKGNFIPILSSSGQHGYWDIPIPTFDDINIAFGKDTNIGTDDMANWSKKKPIAVFRGSSTGCGLTPETNTRLKLATMKAPDLDVGVTNVTSEHIKMDPVYGMGTLNVSDRITPVGKLTFEDQSRYKYIVHVDGNVAAYRLLKMMTLGSVILKVEGDYTLWVEHMMKDKVNCIKIKKDLSDLREKLDWCKEHDTECQEIAKQGREMAIKCLTKEYLYDSFAKTLWDVHDVMKGKKEAPVIEPISESVKSPEVGPKLKYNIKDYFPSKEGVDYSKMKLTEEAVYSVTRRKEGDDLEAYIKSKIPATNSKRIVDTTANVGSDTLRFSQMFKHVDSIEIKKDNFEALKNNVEVFGATNVKLFNDDATKIFDQADWAIDVVYCDPPWGGTEYLKKKSIDVFLGKKRLDVWLAEMLNEDERPPYIILKLPKNYKFERLDELPNVASTDRKQFGNIVIYFIETEE